MFVWQMLVGVLCLTCQVYAVAVPNGTFERAGEDGVLAGWTALGDSVGAISDPSVKHQGKASGRIGVVVGQKPQGMVSEFFEVEAGKLYDVRAFVHLQPASKRRAWVRVAWLDADLKPMPWADMTTSWAVGDEEWTQVAATVVAPRGARFARLLCMGEDWGASYEAFQVWFDSISFSEIAGLPPQKIEIESFPISKKREARIVVGVTDSLGAPVRNGMPVVLQASVGRGATWMPTRNGQAEFVWHVGDGWVLDERIWVACGDVSKTGIVRDPQAGRVVGRIWNTKTQADKTAFVVVQDTLGSVKVRRPFRGAFDVSVPPGQWWITAQVGHVDMPPDLQRIEVAAGDSVVVDLPVRPWVDLKSRGWLAGDVTVRGARGQLDQFVGLDDVVLTTQAAGLDWALLTNYWDASLRMYRPQDLVLDQGGIYGIWGRLFESQWRNVWAMGPSVQDANTVYGAQTLAQKNREILGYGPVIQVDQYASGVVFDLLTGPTFDCLDVMSRRADDIPTQQLWFDFLNLGYRIAATASSQAALDGADAGLSGQFQTFVRLDGDLTPGRMRQALSQGQSFVSSGPLLLFSVFAAGPGSDLPVGHKRRASIRAWASGDPADYLSRVELIRNGEVFESWDLEAHPRTHRLSVTLSDSTDCWYVAKCYGADSSRVALTNPIYFRSDDFETPEALQAVVQGDIQSKSGQPIPEAQVLVKNPLGDVILETTARDGQFRLWAPPTSHVEVQVKNHQTMSQRIVDNGVLVELLNELKHGHYPPDTLVAPETLSRIATALQNIDMLFVLDKN